MKTIYHTILCLLLAISVTKMQGQSDKIQAPKAQSIKIGNTSSSPSIGHFQEVSLGLWESIINGEKTSYEELGRDQWSIALKDYATGEQVSLNLWLDKVSYGGVAKYVVQEVSTDAIAKRTTTAPATPEIPTNEVTNSTPVEPDNSSTNKAEISEYIRQLNYDARELLAVPSEGNFETLPLEGKTERKPFGNKIIKCVKKKNEVDETLTKVSILNPNAGVIFPGALIIGNGRLAEGLPTPITLPRAPMVLSLELDGDGSQELSETIEVAENSSVKKGISNMLDKWNTLAETKGFTTPAKIIKRISKAYSSEQLAVELGFNAKWAEGSASALMNVNTNSEKEVTVAFFQQIFYTITMDNPQRPSDVFDASRVSKTDLQRVIDNKNPPAYVRSVDYGRVVMIRMESNKKNTSIKLEAALDYAVNPDTSIGGELKFEYDNILANSSYRVYAIGGRSDNAAQLVAGNDLSGLRNLIEKDAVYSSSNPGVPIAYTVAWLKDNVNAGIKVSSDYTETECTEYNNAQIKLEHAGGYVARVTVQWSEPDANGVLRTKKEVLGEQTAGWTKTINLPGDAVNININAEAATGLVWAPWGEIMNETLPGPSNCTYKMYGTTLDRKFEVKDCKK